MKIPNPFKLLYRQVKHLFLWASGADLAILKQVPTDQNKYFGIGGTIVFTALMASFAGGYAFFTAFKSMPLAVVFGIFWGTLIFNLDRYIVSTFGVGDGKRSISGQELIEAAPRILMAIVLGFVISTPLELKLFEREIEAEITRQNLVTSQEQKINAVDKAKEQNEFYHEEINTLRNRIDKRVEELDKKKQKRDTAYDKYMCELNGTCGTGVPGDGPVFREAKENYRVLNEEYKRLEDDYLEKNKADNKDIIQYRAAIDENLQAGMQKVAKLEVENDSRDGLLARIEALGTLTSKKASLSAAKWLITLLFILIEIAPILLKMMTERGPYDDIMERIKHEVKTRQLLEQSNLNQEVNMAVKVNTEKNAQKLKAELLANEQLLNSIAQAQAEIASIAVEKWKEQQKEVVKKDPGAMIKTGTS